MDLTTTKKRSSFLSKPLQTVSSLLEIPGVGPVTLERLTRAGIASPQQLIGQFLVLNQNPTAMVSWLRRECSVGGREAAVIAEALSAKAERMAVL